MMMQPAVCMFFRLRSLAIAIDDGAMMPKTVRVDAKGEEYNDEDDANADEGW